MNNKNLLFLMLVIASTSWLTTFGMENDTKSDNEGIRVYDGQGVKVYGNNKNESTNESKLDQQEQTSDSPPLNQVDQPSNNGPKLFGKYIFNQQKKPNNDKNQLVDQDSESDKEFEPDIFGPQIANIYEDVLRDDEKRYLKIDAAKAATLKIESERYINEHRKDSDIKKAAVLDGIYQGMLASTLKQYARKTIVETFKDGILAGIEKGIASLTLELFMAVTKVSIAKGVGWWTQPDKEVLQQLTQKMQFNEAIKDLEKNLEQERKSLIDESTIVTTSGLNVEKAQNLYTKQLEQKKQETEIEIETETKKYTQIFERAKENNITKFIEEQKETYEQKLNEFKQNLGISYTTPLSTEQLQKFNKKLEIEKTNYLLQQNKECTDKIEKLQDLKQIALQNANNTLEKENPDAAFLEIFSEYNNSALNYFRNKRKLRESILLSDMLQNQKSTESGESIEDIFDMLNKRAAEAEAKLAKTA